MLQAIRMFYLRWRLGPFKKGRRSFQGGAIAAIIILAMLVLGVKTLIAPRATFLRVPETAPSTSVLHPNTPMQPALNPSVPYSTRSKGGPFPEFTQSFPQHGKPEPGLLYRIENSRLGTHPTKSQDDALLIVTVFNDAESWGTNRTAVDYFKLISSLNFPKEKVSLALLTSSMEEFEKVKSEFGHQVHHYPRLSVILRNDFSQEGLTRENRHSDALQSNRRRMIARYRNYALLSNLETWHRHVLWLDADIGSIPSELLLKMTQSGLDIVTPMCLRKYDENGDDTYDYDLNAWVGHRKVRPLNSDDFVPGPLSSKNMHDLQGEQQTVVPLDSVGGTMLYVRADVHRQGVIFPAHYIIGSEWGAEGYDGIETEGLCYSAHFLGYKCWGMPKEIIYHAV